MKIKLIDIGWLAGIVEGEGWISFSGTPNLCVKMTDRDVIEKVASLLNKPIYEKKKDKENQHYKQQYTVIVSGNRAIGWMFTLYPLLGKRRKEKILEVISLWKLQKSFREDKFRCGHLKTLENTYGVGKGRKCRECSRNYTKAAYKRG